MSERTKTPTLIGVGAGKFLRVRRIFARIFPNLPEKILGHFLCEYFLMKTVFRMTSNKRKGLHVILGAISFKSKHVGRHFACIFRDFAQIFRDFAKIFTDFA